MPSDRREPDLPEPPQPSTCPVFTDGRHRGWGRRDRTCSCGMVWADDLIEKAIATLNERASDHGHSK